MYRYVSVSRNHVMIEKLYQERKPRIDKLDDIRKPKASIEESLANLEQSHPDQIIQN
jgi:hypothetical protein